MLIKVTTTDRVNIGVEMEIRADGQAHSEIYKNRNRAELKTSMWGKVKVGDSTKVRVKI